MHRRCASFFLVVLLFGLAACHHKQVQNPISNIDSKQPDKVLFDRAMDAMKHNKFDDARMLLQTLINTYPDSEFLARAKLGIGDTWYSDGSTAALSQAEAEYKDFIAFFPNMPEAAEAQLKIAGIEYRQMEKPDRDYVHAQKAEEEYRSVLQQYPDSKLVPEAKERLREVQELLADREFRIGHFYYMRGAWAAAIARLQSLVDAYPLYSGASEALFLQADAYEKQIAFARNNKQPMSAEAKARLLKDFSDHAADAYVRLITRYPIMPRAQDARKRLEAMHRPVPQPTAEAIAQNKAEEESRRHSSVWTQPLQNFRKRPDLSLAARVGEPTLVSPKLASAPAIVRETNEIYAGKAAGADTHAVTVETVNPNSPPTSQPTPRSTPGADEALTPKDTSSAGPAPALPQVNQASSSGAAGAADSGSTGNTASDPSGDTPQSSSKQKGKKGFRRVMPF